MIRVVFSILLLAAVAFPPMAARAGHPLRPAPIWRQDSAGGGAEIAASRLREGKLILVKQGRHDRQRRGDKSRRRDLGREQDRARDAVNAGDVLSLRRILRRIGGRYPGRLLDAELTQRSGGRWIYRLKLLAPDDSVRRLEVDAQSGRVLRGGGG